MPEESEQQAPAPSEPALNEPTPADVAEIPVFDEDPDQPPRIRVVADSLIVRTKADGDVAIALRVPWRMIADMEEKEPREQLYLLLRERGEESMVDRLEELDWVDSSEIVRKFHQALGEKQQARLGESLRSSTS